MTRNALHLLLAAAILACPFRCKLNVCASAECVRKVSSVEKTCDRCCEAGSSAKHDSACKEADQSDTPYRHSPPCEDHCQCICDGAVFANGNEELKQEGTDTPLYELLSSVAPLTEQLARRNTWTMIDLRLVPSGRDVRIKHASFVC